MNSGKKHSVLKAGRAARGAAALELAVSSLITLSVVAFSLNICFAMLYYGINDRACRDAARAAAQGANSTEAFNMAKSAILSYNSNSAVVNTVQVESFEYQDFGGNPPLDKSPFVTVRTLATAKLPAVLSVFGKDIYPALMPVRKSYTFPIVRLTVNPG